MYVCIFFHISHKNKISNSDKIGTTDRIPTAKAITLRVRNLEGGNNIIRMRSSQKISDLRKYIFAEINHSNFRILTLKESGWEPIVDEEQTLLEFGLGPRAALQLAPRNKTYEDIKKHIGT